MAYTAPEPIELTLEETALLDRVSFDLAGPDSDQGKGCLEAACELTKSLIDREAIPGPRLTYFVDSNLQTGRSKSPLAVFEENGVRGDDIFKHRDFLKYLRYFIHGPNLPASIVAGFCRILEDDVGTSGMVLKQLQAYVRAQVRSKHLEPVGAAAEFFKLAHEL